MRYAAVLLSAIALVLSSCSGAVSGQADIESFIDGATNFSVTYDSNGGIGAIAPSVHAVGSSFALDGGSSLTYTLPLHIWNTAADASGVFYPLGATIKMPPRDLTIYAIWGQVFTLTYHDTGMDGGSPPFPNVGYPGDAVSIAGNTGCLYRQGNYAFDGWNTQADGLGKNYAAGSTFVFTNTSEDLYPRWKSVPGPVPLVTPDNPAGLAAGMGRAGGSGDYWIFNGSDQVSYESPNIHFAYNQPFSISVWFMATGLPPLPNYHYWYIVSLMGTYHDFNYFMTLDGPNGGALAACVTKNCVGSNFVTYPVAVNAWHHAVMVYDGRMVELYVDGVSRGTDLYTFGPSPTPMTPMKLGGGSGTYFQGSIGELKVYDRALGADEVMALYSN
jgi:hypothetical protein